MKYRDIFPEHKEHWLELFIICLTLMGLAFLAHSSPSTEYYLDTPIPENPIITLIFAVVAIMVLYSWWCRGDDHKDDPEFPIAKRDWWKKEDE